MPKTFIEAGDEIIEVPWADIVGDQKMADGSWRFKLVGGPYHDTKVRIYPPCDRIVFPGNPPQVYEISPPVRKGGTKWVYVHNINGDTSPMPVTKIMRQGERILDNG